MVYNVDFKKSPKLGFLLIMIGTFFAATGQLFWKAGVMRVNFNAFVTFLNLYFLLGFVCYGIALFFMIGSFKSGELSVIYPVIAMSYVWVSLASPLIFPGDYMTPLRWVGVIIILFSVSLLGISSSKKGDLNYG